MSIFETAGISHVGKVRKNNEDSFIICNEDVTLAAVADGIGGHDNGEVASEMCCTLLAEKFKAGGMDGTWKKDDAAKTLYTWVEEVNSVIFERNKEENNTLPMGSTLCAVLFFPEFAIVANAGDSRFYVLCKEKLTRLTTDHIVIHNGSPFLSRAMGIKAKARPDVSIVNIKGMDKFIIMSDGIYNSMSENAVCKILTETSSAEQAAEKTISTANICGGVDNLTAVVVFRRTK